MYLSSRYRGVVGVSCRRRGRSSSSSRGTLVGISRRRGALSTSGFVTEVDPGSCGEDSSGVPPPTGEVTS